MASKVFGIDFGSDKIKITKLDKGIIYNEKAAMAVKNHKNVIAIGNAAFNMYGKVPDGIEVVFPIKNGVISSFNKLLTLLNCIFLDLTREYGKFKNSIFYVAIPGEITDVEKRSFYELLDKSFIRPKRIILIDKPVADAIGCKLDYEHPDGNLLINIGAETTEITVLSSGGIVLSRLAKFGGHSIDDAILQFVRKSFNIVIGSNTAEKLKISVSAFDGADKDYKVFGRNIVTGLPKDCLITSKILRPCLVEEINQIMEAVKTVLERTPPEIVADIRRNGLVLTGGTAKISGIEDLIEDSLGLKVNVIVNPDLSVINGLYTIMEGKANIE